MVIPTSRYRQALTKLQSLSAQLKQAHINPQGYAQIVAQIKSTLPNVSSNVAYLQASADDLPIGTDPLQLYLCLMLSDAIADEMSKIKEGFGYNWPFTKSETGEALLKEFIQAGCPDILGWQISAEF